jgi:hypothetical protein
MFGPLRINLPKNFPPPACMTCAPSPMCISGLAFRRQRKLAYCIQQLAWLPYGDVSTCAHHHKRQESEHLVYLRRCRFHDVEWEVIDEFLIGNDLEGIGHNHRGILPEWLGTTIKDLRMADCNRIQIWSVLSELTCSLLWDNKSAWSKVKELEWSRRGLFNANITTSDVSFSISCLLAELCKL